MILMMPIATMASTTAEGVGLYSSAVTPVTGEANGILLSGDADLHEPVRQVVQQLRIAVEQRQRALDVRGDLLAQCGGIAGRLLALVSEKTGYPVEMLTLEMDMEAERWEDALRSYQSVVLGAADKLPPPELAQLLVARDPPGALRSRSHRRPPAL